MKCQIRCPLLNRPPREDLSDEPSHNHHWPARSRAPPRPLRCPDTCASPDARHRNGDHRQHHPAGPPWAVQAQAATVPGAPLNLRATPYSPGTPTGVSAEVRWRQVVIEWDNPADVAMTHHRIYRQTEEAAEILAGETDGPGTTSFTDPGTKKGKTHVYRVSAVGAAIKEKLPILA